MTLIQIVNISTIFYNCIDVFVQMIKSLNSIESFQCLPFGRSEVGMCWYVAAVNKMHKFAINFNFTMMLVTTKAFFKEHSL